MSKEANKYQHYVPQCYLRHFAHNNNKSYYLNAYDVVRHKSYNVSVSKVCGVNNLYTLTDEFVNNHKNEKANSLSIESDFFAAKIENQLAGILTELNEKKRNCINGNEKKLSIDTDLRMAFSIQIAIQFLRHPLIKEKIIQKTDNFLSQVIKIAKFGLSKELEDEKVNDLDIQPVYDKAANHARLSFANESEVKMYAKSFADGYWIFFYTSRNDFYTSDHPINYYQSKNCNKQESVYGKNYGSEIFIPISPDLLLISFDKRYYSKFKESDCAIYKANDICIKRQNYFHFQNANQFVFSYTNNFDMNL